MISFTHRSVFPYDKNFLYTLISDVEKYPEFLPWCHALEICKRVGNTLEADMTVGYNMFKTTYRSQVLLSPNNEIKVIGIPMGPLKKLESTWKFSTLPDGQTEITFTIHLALASKIFQKILSHKFADGAERLMKAFQERAQCLSA